MAERMLRTKDVAEMVGVSPGTLRYWRHSGRGPRYAKLEGSVRYRESEVAAWIDAQFDGSPAA